jgi:hypothetical protein
VRDTLEQVLSAVADGNLERDQLLDVLADIDAVRKLLKDARDDVDRALIAVMPFRQPVTAAGATWIVGTRNAKVTWHDRETGMAIVNRQLELDAAQLGHPRDVVDLLLRCAHVDYWRVTPIEEMGLKPNDYRVRTGGEPTVSKAG